MSTISVRLPPSLHAGVREAARREGISINAFISAAVGEKLSAWETESLLTPRAARGDRGRYLAALAQAAPADPPPDDAL